MSAKVVNLRTRRKQLARIEARQTATENAARHGRSKADRTLDAARADKAARDLDGHRRQDD